MSLFLRPDKYFSRKGHNPSVGKDRGPRQLKLLFLLTGMGEAIRISETVGTRNCTKGWNVHLTSFLFATQRNSYFIKLNCCYSHLLKALAFSLFHSKL